jgi:putative tricarboxylic transport membrane protein
MRAAVHPGLGAVAALWIAQAVIPSSAVAAWEPTRPVEFIVPAGTGGGADQMARTIQGIVTKHNLMKQSMVVINKAGGAGGEGFLDVKASRGNPHKIVITLSNLFTTPLATGIPFNWKDLTPVAMLALDEFVLWVNADKPYKSVKEYIDAAKAANGQMKMGGTGSKQEDQIITVGIEKSTGAKFTYIPYKGGGEVAVQSATTSIPRSTTRSRRWRSGAEARCGRCAYSTARSSTITTRSRATCPGTAFLPASRRGSIWNT